MLAKIENDQLKFLPKTYTHDGITISNYNLLPEKTLLSHGWKPFIETPVPELDEGIGYNPVYVDNGDNISLRWETYEVQIDDTGQPIDELQQLRADVDYIAIMAGVEL